MKRILVLSDLQIPYHDRKVVEAIYRFIRAYKPDEIASVGDDVDFPQISRWNKGLIGEYRSDIQSHVDAGLKHFERLREEFDGPIHVSRSNHMDRPLQYISRYAPGLLGLKSLSIPSMFEFQRLGINWHEEMHEIAPGWLLGHGDEPNSKAVSPVAGGQALKLARKTGMSVICGHTHRAGIQHDHTHFKGRRVRGLYGVEVGNMMDMRKADYLGQTGANWQQAFGILYVDGRHVSPSLININGGKFIVEGKTYS